MHLHATGNVEDENIVSWIKLPGTVLRTSIYRDVVEDGIVLLPEISRDVCSTEAIRKCVKCSVRVRQKKTSSTLVKQVYIFTCVNQVEIACFFAWQSRQSCSALIILESCFSSVFASTFVIEGSRERARCRSRTGELMRTRCHVICCACGAALLIQTCVHIPAHLNTYTLIPAHLSSLSSRQD